MKVLIVGTGGREHAIAKALAKSECTVCTVGKWRHPGMPKVTIMDIDDPELVANHAKKSNFDMVIVGSEQQLEQGLADRLAERGIFCLGPTRELAKIETNKLFARLVIPKEFNPRYFLLSSTDELDECLDVLNEEYVIKPLGLTGGKGVKVSGKDLSTREEAQEYAQELLKTCGAFLLEERLDGQEFVVMSFVDGVSTRDMPVVVDYKRLLAGNKGPNTGSMGCVSFPVIFRGAPFLNPKDLQTASRCNAEVAKYLAHISGGYKGILYGSFIKTLKGEIKVIEYNARFGDPEVINVLELLQTDLLEIIKAIRDSRLSEIDIKWSQQAVVTQYLVCPGYPNSFEQGWALEIGDTQPIFGKVLEDKGLFIQLGSRSLALCSIADTLEEAREANRQKISKVVGNFVYRDDIGESLY